MRLPSVLSGLPVVLGIVAPGSLAAQGGAIAGTVVNRASGAPVADAQIAVVGTTLRTFSDAGGRFRLSDVPGATAVLQVRRIQYRPAQDTVHVGDANVRIALEEKALELEGVVVTGTPAATAQRELGNAVSRIDAAAIVQQAPINSFQDLLNGRAAGVLIQPATGAVGSGSRIRIRGASSFSLSNQPLVYVDGVRVDADFSTGPQNQDFGSSSISRYNDFNPDDIESVEILKGPAAATLYGTEASNGVIQIVTKRGTPGPARWSFTLRQGVNYLSNPEGRFPTNYQIDGSGNLVRLNFTDLESRVGDIFRTGHVSDYQASVSGGSNVVRYYAAGGTELQGGAEPSNDFRHTSGRANLTITPSEKVTLSANVGYVSGPTHVSCEAGCGGRVWSSILANPLNVSDPLRLGFHSGLPAEYDEVYHFTQGLDRFTGSIQLQHHPVKWFTHRITFGVDRTREDNSTYAARVDSLITNPTFSDGYPDIGALGYIGMTNRSIENTTLDYAATASFDLSSTLRSSTSGGVQFYHTLTDTTFAEGWYFPAEGLSAIDATTGPRNNAGGLEETKSIGAYGQEQIAWRDRLFVTAGVRSDDHSTFGANFNRVYYPKASVSWLMGEEPFWKVSFVNQLRLRAAYGESGRAPPSNATVRSYAPTTGSGDVTAVTPQNIGNPALGPERGKELELGLDAGFWNDRLGIEFTYYRKRTVDEILQRETAPSIGFPPVFPGGQYFNAGSVLNQGIELLARGRPYDHGPVSVDMTLNLSTNTNEVQSLLPATTSVSAGTFIKHRVGYPVGSWFAKKAVSAQLDATGKAINVMCEDGKGGVMPCAGADGIYGTNLTTLTNDDAPDVYLGRTTPNFQGAFNTTVTLWNRLRVYGLLDFETGFRKLDGNTRVRCTFFGGRCLENFRPFNSDPVRVAEVQSNRNLVDFLIDDASFLKLREVSVSYTLPDLWARGVGASRATVSLAGRNLYTWTRYGGLEPEAMFLGGLRGGQYGEWEQTTLPQLTQWVLTVNVDY